MFFFQMFRTEYSSTKIVTCLQTFTRKGAVICPHDRRTLMHTHTLSHTDTRWNVRLGGLSPPGPWSTLAEWQHRSQSFPGPPSVLRLCARPVKAHGVGRVGVGAGRVGDCAWGRCSNTGRWSGPPTRGRCAGQCWVRATASSSPKEEAHLQHRQRAGGAASTDDERKWPFPARNLRG